MRHVSSLRAPTLGRSLIVMACLAAPAPATAQVVRLSVSTTGAQANGASTAVAVNGDGRYVVFESAASNLVDGDTNHVTDIFLHDRDTDADGVFDEAGAFAVTRLNLGPGGVQANNASSDPAMTPDGRFVAFVSKATNLAVGAPAEVLQIYRLDRTTGAIVLVSANDAGVAGDAHSEDPVISDDGDVVAFASLATTLVGGPATTTIGVFVREIGAGRTTRVTPPGPASPVHYAQPKISADGRRLVYRGTNAMRPTIFGAIVHDWATELPRPLFPPIAFSAFLSPSGGRAVSSHLLGEVVRHALSLNVAETFAWPGGSGSGPLAVSPSGRFAIGGDQRALDMDFGATSQSIPPVLAAAFDRHDRWFVIATTVATFHDPAIDTNGVADVYVYPAERNFDTDGDGLNDGWEAIFAATDPAADPDGDGATNLQEFVAGTHPTATARRFLAEGATGSFFTTDIALANPDPALAAGVLLTFDTGAGVRVLRALQVPPGRSLVVHAGGLPGLESAAFATTIESDRPVGVSRAMAWDTRPTDDVARGYGLTLESSVAAPSPTWFLAEGSTVVGFELFYLLQNPQTTVTRATIRFLLPAGSVVTRTYDLPPRSRTTVYVNQVPGLDETDVSGDIAADAPIVVERAMYRSRPEEPFVLGHGGVGATAPSLHWFLAEGATGTFFDLYVLIANPGSVDAVVDARYAKPDGTVITRQHAVRANSRFTVYVDGIAGLEDTPVATTIASTNGVPVVVERAMYWPGGFFDYYAGHSAAGSTATAGRWVVAGGEESGPANAQTFVLIANTSSQATSVQLQVLPLPGVTPPPGLPSIVLPPNSRTTVPITGAGSRFGVLVSTLGPGADLVVESAVYRSVGGVLWSAGGNALATALP